MPLPQQPGPHELKYLAQELGQAVRTLVERHDALREQLFLAAREAKKQSKTKAAAPKCGARTATGQRCATRLQPGQFRCDLHAAEMRQRRKGQVTVPIGASERGDSDDSRTVSPRGPHAGARE
jgi:hypothetical protein